MSISPELFMAILSMDSYNRGYNSDVGDDLDGLGESGSIGNATLIDQTTVGIGEPEYQAWKDSGFYAIAYKLDAAVGDLAANTTIISYRGTDDCTSWGSENDIISGWPLGGGR